jgi:F-type H+-transporting ATPase subunit epsilon
MVKISKLSTIEEEIRHLYAVSGGVLFYKDNEATLLADAFESEDEIDLDRALAAKERAEKRLDSQDSNIDDKRAKIALLKAINRISLKE